MQTNEIEKNQKNVKKHIAGKILESLNEKKMNLNNYKAAKDMHASCIRRDELRRCLLYIRMLVEIWVLFIDIGLESMDSTEFDEAVSRLHCWGIQIKYENRKKLFKLIDKDGSNNLSFLEFSDFVVKMLFNSLNEQ